MHPETDVVRFHVVGAVLTSIFEHMTIRLPLNASLSTLISRKPFGMSVSRT